MPTITLMTLPNLSDNANFVLAKLAKQLRPIAREVLQLVDRIDYPLDKIALYHFEFGPLSENVETCEIVFCPPADDGIATIRDSMIAALFADRLSRFLAVNDPDHTLKVAITVNPTKTAGYILGAGGYYVDDWDIYPDHKKLDLKTALEYYHGEMSGQMLTTKP